VKSTKSATTKSATMKSATMKSATMKSATMKSATMKSAAVEAPAAATAVETSTPASPMWPGVGKIWLTERGGAQHSRCDGQNPSVLRPGFNFA
jgi:hypothetical protein